MKKFKLIICLIVWLIACFVLQPIAVLACSSCGCSEICPVAMMEETENSTSDKNGTSLSDSIWGNMILKMAYQMDPEMQKCKKHLKRYNSLTNGAVTGAIGGTVAQNIISVTTLNPPEGLNDSYLPGGLGLGMSGLINVVLDGAMFTNWHYKKKIQARQIIIANQVESILHHLEFSETTCPEAQKELASIIGERGASDCIKLWQFSHATAAASIEKTL